MSVECVSVIAWDGSGLIGGRQLGMQWLGCSMSFFFFFFFFFFVWPCLLGNFAWYVLLASVTAVGKAPRRVLCWGSTLCLLFTIGIRV